LCDFDKIEIKDDVRPLILKENAARLLKLPNNPLRPTWTDSPDRSP
jgi:hypothetical protein